MEACVILIVAHARLLVLVRKITLEFFVEHVLILKIIDIKQKTVFTRDYLEEKL
jgi:hypothetical protein